MNTTMSITTKTGDKGKTTLCNGEIVYKDDIRIETCGVVDELNSALGVVISLMQNNDDKKLISTIQNTLFVIGSNLSMPLDNNAEKLPLLSENDIQNLELHIYNLEKELPQLKHFILPQGNQLSTNLFLARAICRRAERIIISYVRNRKTNNQERKKMILLIIKYINRLSDLLFLLARQENVRNNISEIEFHE